MLAGLSEGSILLEYDYSDILTSQKNFNKSLFSGILPTPRPSVLTVRVLMIKRVIFPTPNIKQMSASTSKAGESSKPAEKTQSNLGVLEEDDEFEEFAVAGQLRAIEYRLR